MSSQTADTSAQEATPLLAGENRDDVDRDAADADVEQNDSAQSSETNDRSLSRIDKFLSRFLVVVVVTSVIQLAFTLAAYIMTQISASRYGFWDYELDPTLFYFVVMDILAIIVALYDIVLLRRKGYPGNAGLNVLVGGVGGVLFVRIAVMAIIDKVWRMGREVCHDQHSHVQCLRWARQYMVIMWIYLIVALILGIEYLVLFVTFLIKAYGRGSKSPPSSSSSWYIPRRFVTSPMAHHSYAFIVKLITGLGR